ncbi:hypothetical protein KY285_026462 [Solanum tuberosum]|nr:hypothetical protein KY285_026462 [Solanum tuberosum]
MTLSRGRSRGAAPMRGRAIKVSPKPQIDDRENQVSPEITATPLLQDTLLSVISVLESFTRGGGATVTPRNSQTRERAQTHEHQQAPVIQDAVKQPPVDPMVWNDLAPVVGGQVALPIVLTEDEQRRYEKFRKMDPPQFQGGKSEYTYEFLTTCRELLEALQENVHTTTLIW